MSTEFLKGHLCFLPFTLYSINALLFTTSNLLFTLYHLQFTIPIYHLGFTIYHFQSTFIYFQLFTTFNLHVLLFIFLYLLLSTEFLKGHLCFLPFTFIFYDLLLIIYCFIFYFMPFYDLPPTIYCLQLTFLLLTIYILLITTSNLL